MRDMETIIVLVLVEFNFVSYRAHYSLTLQRSRFGYFATVTPTPGDGTITIKLFTTN